MLRPDQITRLQARFPHLLVSESCSVMDSWFGHSVVLGEAADIYYSRLGKYSYVARNTIVCYTQVGRFCSIGPNCVLGLPNHPATDFVSTHPLFYLNAPGRNLTFADRSYFQGFVPTWIGHDVWIGANASIRAGLTIGNGAIIGAGAVVTKDVPPYAIVGGVPAKTIRSRFTPDQIAALQAAQWWDRDEAWLQAHFRDFHHVADFLANLPGPETLMAPGDGGPSMEEIWQKGVANTWRDDRGDQTLRLTYPLTKDSLVWDVGGYRGDFAAEILARYGCQVHIFEPVPTFAAHIRQRFQNDPRITLYEEGLAATTRQEQISLQEDASSVFGVPPSGGVEGGKLSSLSAVSAVSAANSTTISLLSISEALARLGPPSRDIDLLKINIEGAEYELLDALLASGQIRRIRDLQIQFHPFVPGAFQKRQALLEKLAPTHRPTWTYPFVWENHTRL